MGNSVVLYNRAEKEAAKRSIVSRQYIEKLVAANLAFKTDQVYGRKKLPVYEMFEGKLIWLSRATSISARTIEEAYVKGNVGLQKFIEEYGKLSQEFLQSLIRPFVPDPFEGRAIFTSVNSDDVRPKYNSLTERSELGLHGVEDSDSQEAQN